jgi:predicted nucleic acid-binding protein
MEENKNLYIVDASVMLKWVLKNEDEMEIALRVKNDFIFEKITLSVPTHAFYEVMNTVGLKSPDEMLTFLSYLHLLRMEEYNLGIPLASTAQELMKKFKGVTFYDAVYHALAINLGGTFITADKKYFEKTRSAKHIKLLKNY